MMMAANSPPGARAERPEPPALARAACAWSSPEHGRAVGRGPGTQDFKL